MTILPHSIQTAADKDSKGVLPYATTTQSQHLLPAQRNTGTGSSTEPRALLCCLTVRCTPNIPHFCIQVSDLSEFIEKTKAAGARVSKGSYNEKNVYFIEDFSGNRIEVKPL